MYIYLYDRHSESGIALARAVNAAIIRHENSRFKGAPNKVVLNWGCSNLPYEVRKCSIINNEQAVQRAINKLWSFQQMGINGVSTVPWTDRQDVANGWLLEGSRVVVRGQLKGFDGAGLTITNPGQQLPAARLFTKFVDTRKEYRITCFRTRAGEISVIGRQRKVPLDGAVNINPDVKTTAGGYGFKWVTLNIPEEVEDVAKRAIAALNLDFGGVDVVWNGVNAFVLEVNTAPHLTPIMVQRLGEAINRDYGN